jgi:hypothetical protein
MRAPSLVLNALRRAIALVATAALVCTIGGGAAPAAHAWPGQGRHGLQGGWAVDDIGHINFIHSLSLQYGFIHQAGAGWVRINFRLGACYSDWTSPSDICPGADAPTALGIYDQVVDKALANNLQVLGLISNESWRGSQAEWMHGNFETHGGNGDNAYIRSFARDAAGVLAEHFRDRVSVWEVWNEPNAWTEHPREGVFQGGSFVYPSNFAWILKRSYAEIKRHQPGTSSTVISGGLFGHDMSEGAPPVSGIKGASLITGRPITCANSVASGADYLCLTYAAGIEHAGWQAGQYPLDRIGQHLYIDQGNLSSPARIAQYVDDVRAAYRTYEGTDTPKSIEMTEIGWVADPNAPDYDAQLERQAANLKIAYDAFSNMPHVSRAYWFSIQDIPEAQLFVGQIDGGNSYSLGTPKYPSFSAFQRYAR